MQHKMMSPNIPPRNNIPPPAAKMQLLQEGIVTILCSDDDGERSKSASIRRTLSADMSSKKWLQQNGFIKRTDHHVSIPSSFSSSSSSVDEEDVQETVPCQDDVWRSIQAEKERNQNQIPQPQQAAANAWGSMTMILSHQNNINSLIPPPPPYVHPLVKRSGSTLSEKSLEICTESLGSETGSDCPLSEMSILSDSDEERERAAAIDQEEAVVKEMISENPFKDLHVVKYKKSPARPFPPPLSSTSAGAGEGGTSLHVTSRRENGRLILEAVSVPARNCFRSERRNGRLVLTLVRTPADTAEEKNEEEFEKVFDDMQEVGEEDDCGDDVAADDGGEDDVAADDGGEDDVAAVEEEVSLPSGMVSVHKSGLVMKKFTAVGNLNPTKMWSKNFNKASPMEINITNEMNAMLPNIVPQSLPPPPRAARLIPSQAVAPLPTVAASFNAYEYFWRNKTTTDINGRGMKNSGDGKFNGRSKGYVNEELVVRKEEYYCVPYLKGCKEPRRSLSLWEDSYCIATS